MMAGQRGEVWSGAQEYWGGKLKVRRRLQETCWQLVGLGQ